jgi:hypothetical protein
MFEPRGIIKKLWLRPQQSKNSYQITRARITVQAMRSVSLSGL